MPRKYFINPYTFVPLDQVRGPLLEPDTDDHQHLWFDQKRFTGRLDLELTLVTPTVIPDKVTKGEKPGANPQNPSGGPGLIKGYEYNGHLAIPGSRLRGHLLNLMRAINSSPLQNYNKWVFLRRDNRTHKKGFLYLNNIGALRIQEIDDEILVADPGRHRYPSLQCQGGCLPEANPVAYDPAGRSIAIPPYNPDVPPAGQKTANGTVYYHNPNWGAPGAMRYKKYLVQKDVGRPFSERSGRWVRFLAWTGQDGQNRFKDIGNNQPKVHLLSHHLVNLGHCGSSYPLRPDTIESFKECAEAAAKLVEERRDAAEKSFADDIRSMKDNLIPGQFVYFEVQGKDVVSLGLHYRYMVYKGRVEETVERTNNGVSRGGQPGNCLVRNLGGYAGDMNQQAGRKGRLWVEMALGPRKDELVEKGQYGPKNLRILSSQPPKNKFFYLSVGDYGQPGATVRGRKFYWHDPCWEKRMWDNQDLDQGDHAFENPEPKDSKLFEQWSKADVIMAREDRPVSFDLTIRGLNWSQDEFFLLLTALVGFAPEVLADNHLGQTAWKKWCHKIGHARPFMGSGYFTLTGIEKLAFDPASGAPLLETENMADLVAQLTAWQNQLLNSPAVTYLKRIMHFDGARQDLAADKSDAPIAYPLGQEHNLPPDQITWKNQSGRPLHSSQRPKPYVWFTRRRDTPLPEPAPGRDQTLEVFFNRNPNWREKPPDRDQPPRPGDNDRSGSPPGPGGSRRGEGRRNNR